MSSAPQLYQLLTVEGHSSDGQATSELGELLRGSAVELDPVS